MTAQSFKRSIINVQTFIFFAFFTIQGMADWTLLPHLGISEIYTDNVELATHGQEEKEYITQINPGFLLSGQGARSAVNLDYQIYGLKYAKNNDSDSVNQEALLDSTYRIYDDNLFIDASGEYTKSIINAAERHSLDSYFISPNRTDTSTIQVSPYLRNAFNGGVLGEVRARYGQVDYVDVDGLDSSTKEISAHLNGRGVPGRLNWYFEYSDRNIKYENRQEADFERFTGELGFEVASRLTWLLISGYEDNTYQYSGNDYVSSDNFWRSGIRWTPTRRSSIEATTGERFFGKTYSFILAHHTRNTFWNVEYQEELQSSGFERLEDLDENVVNSAGTQTETMTSLLTNDVFISKGLLCNVRWQKSKTYIRLNLSRFVRDYQYDNNREIYFHRSIVWAWHILPRIESTIDYSVEDHEFSVPESKSQLKRIGVALAYNLNARASASFQYNKNDYDGSEMHTDYQANSVILQFGMAF